MEEPWLSYASKLSRVIDLEEHVRETRQDASNIPYSAHAPDDETCVVKSIKSMSLIQHIINIDVLCMPIMTCEKCARLRELKVTVCIDGRREYICVHL